MSHRFFAPSNQISEGRIILDPEEANHLTRVLRLGEGAHVQVFDGSGREYHCEVLKATRNMADLTILSEIVEPVEAALRVTLGQALIKSDKFDWVAQKATELGVARIVPLTTKYSERLRTDEHWQRRQHRWERISLESLKQSGRRQLVEIHEPTPWEDFCESEDSELRLVLAERGGKTLQSVAAEHPGPFESVSVSVGPEGGWDETEIKIAEAAGLIPIHLGPRILRTETAAVTAVSLVQYLYGDFGE